MLAPFSMTGFPLLFSRNGNLLHVLQIHGFKTALMTALASTIKQPICGDAAGFRAASAHSKKIDTSAKGSALL